MKIAKKKDLSGMKFGKLTVKHISTKTNKGGHTHWICDCDCGSNNVVIDGTKLANKHTKSCGCLKHDGSRYKKYNTYDLTGNYGIGYTRNNDIFYFDLEDYELIKDYCWRKIGGESEHQYIASTKDNGSPLLLSRLVTNCLENKNKVVDHKNHNTLDNRKSNLRITTQSFNGANKNKMSNNKSGVSGVFYDKERKKWRVEIGLNYKNHYIGRYDLFEDAVKARKDAEEKYFGEYSYENSMKMGGNIY